MKQLARTRRMAGARGPLATYRRKRDFAATPEPRGTVGRSRNRFRLVVQKHAARRLHFDFRLELHGVLKSWAVTKGPSFDPSVPRLAVRTEDHPLEYSGFEDIIPQGHYGAGTVMLWDRGRWAPGGDPGRGLACGKLDFERFGARMKGRWHLLRARSRQSDHRQSWLLIKGADEHAQRGHGDTVVRTGRRSIRSARSMSEIAAARRRRPAGKRANRQER